MVVAFNFTFSNVCYPFVTAYSIQGENKGQIWLMSTMFIKKIANSALNLRKMYIAINVTWNSNSMYLLPVMSKIFL